MRRGFRRLTAALLCAVLLLLPAGCRSGAEKGRIKYVIGVSQANMREPWRLVLIRELQEEAARASGDPAGHNRRDRRRRKASRGHPAPARLRHRPADRLAPTTSSGSRRWSARLYQKIPVIVLDRVVEGYDYSLFIGPDNDLIGKQAGEAAVRLVPGLGGEGARAQGRAPFAGERRAQRRIPLGHLPFPAH